MFHFDQPKHPLPADIDADTPPASDTVLKVIGVARRNAGRMALFGAIGLTAAVAFSALVPPSYTATAEILVNPNDLNLVDNALTRQAESADSGATYSETQAKILGSDSVLARAVKMLGLDGDSRFVHEAFWRDGGLLEDGMVWLGAPASGGDAGRSALDRLKALVSVRRTERTFVIDVSAKSGDPALAANLANGVVNAYLAEKSDARTTLAERASADFTASLGTLRDAVRSADDAVVAFRTKHRLIGGTSGSITDQQINDAVAALSRAHESTEQARARYEQMQEAVAGSGQESLPDVVQSVELRNLRQTLQDLLRRQAQLAAQFGPRYPEMIDVSANIAQTERAVSTQVSRLVASARKDYDRATSAEKGFASSLDRLRNEGSVNAVADVTLRQLQADLDAKRSIYEAYLKRAKETAEQARIDPTDARVISAADEPLKRSFPPSPAVLLPGGLLLGACLGLALAILFPARAVRSPRPALRPSYGLADQPLGRRAPPQFGDSR